MCDFRRTVFCFHSYSGISSLNFTFIFNALLSTRLLLKVVSLFIGLGICGFCFKCHLICEEINTVVSGIQGIIAGCKPVAPFVKSLR